MSDFDDIRDLLNGVSKNKYPSPKSVMVKNSQKYNIQEFDQIERENQTFQESSKSLQSMQKFQTNGSVESIEREGSSNQRFNNEFPKLSKNYNQQIIGGQNKQEVSAQKFQDQVLQDYYKIQGKYQGSYLTTEDGFPNPDQLQADNEKLINLTNLLNDKIYNIDRLSSQNKDLKAQIGELDTQLKQYKQKLKSLQIQNRHGIQTIEVPCKHSEEINQLNVHINSKRNELKALKVELNDINKQNKAELSKLYKVLQGHISENKKIKQQTQVTEANVINMEKINYLKGQFLDLDKEKKILKSEMESLRKIKDEQYKHLENITEVKNYPRKLKELFNQIREQKTKQKLIEDRIKDQHFEKKVNFEKILKLEDKIKELKNTKKIAETPSLLKQKNLAILAELKAKEKELKEKWGGDNPVNQIF